MATVLPSFLFQPLLKTGLMADASNFRTRPHRPWTLPDHYSGAAHAGCSGIFQAAERRSWPHPHPSGEASGSRRQTFHGISHFQFTALDAGFGTSPPLAGFAGSNPSLRALQSSTGKKSRAAPAVSSSLGQPLQTSRPPRTDDGSWDRAPYSGSPAVCQRLDDVILVRRVLVNDRQRSVGVGSERVARSRIDTRRRRRPCRFLRWRQLSRLIVGNRHHSAPASAKQAVMRRVDRHGDRLLARRRRPAALDGRGFRVDLHHFGMVSVRLAYTLPSPAERRIPACRRAEYS